MYFNFFNLLNFIFCKISWKKINSSIVLFNIKEKRNQVKKKEG